MGGRRAGEHRQRDRTQALTRGTLRITDWIRVVSLAESVAYAETRATVHRLAGLPDSRAHVESLSHRTIPASLALLNTAYVLAHQAELAAVISASVGLEFFTPPDRSVS